MRNLSHVLAVATTLALNAIAANATIRVEVSTLDGNGNLVPITALTQTGIASGAAITIPLGTLGAEVYRLVRIYDPTPDATTGLPDEDIGSVTLTGTAAATAQVDIAVVGRDPTFDDGFPLDPRSRINALGARSFGMVSAWRFPCRR